MKIFDCDDGGESDIDGDALVIMVMIINVGDSDHNDEMMQVKTMRKAMMPTPKTWKSS